jgi:hypothetical protein
VLLIALARAELTVDDEAAATFYAREEDQTCGNSQTSE